jgi:cytochrome c oxidase cbb3-type subunit 3
MSDKKSREIDAFSGVETTGHEWDGIKELNKPLPRWWIWTFYACIVWSIGYWIVYPAWPIPGGYTKGIWNYSQRAVVAAEGEAARAAQGTLRKQIETTALGDIRKNQDLLRFAMAAGNASFQTNCSACHGRGAQGFTGYPNLNDDDWLWGGSVEEIEKTILYGVRSEHKDTRSSAMPRFGLDKILKDHEIDDVSEYVMSLTKRSTNAKAVESGAKIYTDQCASCHGADGKGIVEQGSANLTDGIWLYGNSKAAIMESIRTGRNGQMPYWTGRLDTVTLKSLAVYVHSLGGGK